ncbi:zinc-binding dehydrogenase [Pseudomonas sp. 7P_10.2_Bac1]|nr:zinc-binding dehydrogenase [Pseudomonas sp. 7P_10.2_Bac1]MCU1726075.1 zinc-binding dehydrogenase [Pseudomonas sp. 7P_10.2_Bac1]
MEASAFAARQPVIDRVFPFKQAAQAYAYLKSGSHFGKVVIEVQ